MRKLGQQIPFAISAAVFVALMAFQVQQSIRTNDGLLIYTVDDPYIHMAMAKNLAEYGIFAIAM